MYEIRPSDRVQIRQRPELMAPACCAICGNGTCLEGFVDPGIFYDWEGQVYFCIPCGLEIARALGCLMPDESRYLEKLNAEMADELKANREKLDGLRAIADSVKRLTGVDAISSGGSISKMPESKSDNPPASADGPATRKPVAKKSVASSRSNDAAQSTVRNEQPFTI